MGERAAFVAVHLANELRAAGSQAGDDGVDVVDCECDMADAGGLHHRDLRPDVLEPPHAVYRTALDPPLAMQLESELDEEPPSRPARSSTTMPTCSMRWIVMRSTPAGGRPQPSVSRLPIGSWERADHWSEETSDELLGSIG